MQSFLSRIPWFAGAPAFVAAVVVAAVVANYLGADYFKRTRLDEVNPLVVGSASTPAGPAVAETPIPAASPAAMTVVSAQGPVVVSSGEFRDGEPGHRGSGKATLGRDANGRALLVLEDFSVTNGPDLRVILGEDAGGGGDGLDLGKLKATDGTFSYEIPAETDLNSFRSVTIWCAAFPTIFAVATLEG